jgi:hypothetical protein
VHWGFTLAAVAALAGGVVSLLGSRDRTESGRMKSNGKESFRRTQWRHWNPGLDNDNDTLGKVYATLPIHEFSSYPWIVRVVENPKSPVALKGKCSLFRHDLIHVLLGRGLFVQDEAFVIGYTMGTSKRIGGFEKEFFKFCAHHLYPPKYRFTKDDLLVYDLGFTAGQVNKIEIFDIDLESMLGEKLGVLRAKLGISTPLLRHLNSVERSVSTTTAGQRIPHYFPINQPSTDNGA